MNERFEIEMVVYFDDAVVLWVERRTNDRGHGF